MCMDITAVGAINAAIRPNGSTFAAMTHIRDNDTFSRPPTDLRGSSCGMRGFWDKPTILWDYDACAAGSSKYPLAGVRGKYGKQIKLTTPHFCLSKFAVCLVLQ